MKWNNISLIFICLLCIQIVVSKVDARRRRLRRGGKCECGRSLLGRFALPEKEKLTRIINGDPVKPIYKYPWMISILIGKSQVCTGSIIAPNKVLTAAHCILTVKGDDEDCEKVVTLRDRQEYCEMKAKEFTVRHVQQNGLSRPVQVISIAYSENYSMASNENDVAVLTIEGTFPCNRFTSAICLPSRDMAEIDTELIIAGWGQNRSGPKELMGSNLPLLEGRAKVRNLTRTGRSRSTCRAVTSRSHFCATGDNQNTCFGDSGGPIFRQEKDGLHYVAGVSSFGSSATCQKNSEEYFTNIYQVRSFIDEQLTS